MPSATASPACPKPAKAPETTKVPASGSGRSGGSPQADFLKSVFAEITGRQPPRGKPRHAAKDRLRTD